MSEQSLVQAHIVPSLYSLADLIVLKSITPLHAGTGRASGVVDLPIQRDEYGYPCVYASSIKGALKTSLLYAFTKEFGNDYENARKAVQAVLGPEPEEGESFESAIAVLDAYLLTFPVRSLKGVYTYVTTPTLLRRFCDRLEILESYLEETGKESKEETIATKLRNIIEILEEKIANKTDVAVCTSGGCDSLKVNELGGKAILVEEVFLDVKSLGELGASGESIKFIDKLIRSKLKLEKPLLVVSDDVAREVIERGLFRLTRVRLNRETKTVERGALWTEEYLPPKTILHSLILYKKPPLSKGFVKSVLGKHEEDITEKDYLEALKKLHLLDDNKVKRVEASTNLVEKLNLLAEAIREVFRRAINEQLRGYLILGGHETIGKGIVKVEFLDTSGLP